MNQRLALIERFVKEIERHRSKIKQTAKKMLMQLEELIKEEGAGKERRK
jgi:hypothetical protein